MSSRVGYRVERSGWNFRVRLPDGSYMEGIAATRETARRWIRRLEGPEGFAALEVGDIVRPCDRPADGMGAASWWTRLERAALAYNAESVKARRGSAR